MKTKLLLFDGSAFIPVIEEHLKRKHIKAPFQDLILQWVTYELMEQHDLVLSIESLLIYEQAQKYAIPLLLDCPLYTFCSNRLYNATLKSLSASFNPLHTQPVHIKTTISAVIVQYK